MAINVRAWLALPPLKPKSGSVFDIAAYGLNWLTFVVGIGFIGLHAVPQLLFGYSASAGAVTLYSANPLPSEADKLARQAAELASKSELAQQGVTDRVYISDRFWLYRLFNPQGHSFAIFMPLTGNIFVANGDVKENVAYSDAEAYNKRGLSTVIAHEMTHHLIQERLGALRSFRLPAWLSEGYCDYVAGESSFPEREGLRLIAAGQFDPSPSFEYFQSRKVVQYLIEQRHMPFEEIAEQALKSDVLQKEALRAIGEGLYAEK